MKKALTAPSPALLLLLASLFLPACGEDDVGVPCGQCSSNGSACNHDVDCCSPLTCKNGSCVVPEAAVQTPLITSNALDCRSRLCLTYGDPNDEKRVPLCTKICESDDDCPSSGPRCPNNERFVCNVGVEIGALACCKMCICKYFVSSGAAPSSCSRITPNCPTL
jgi:hypothetical protein